MRPYHELPNLDDLYLQDSWVLDVQETPDEVRFRLDAVLRETHPKWSPPKNEHWRIRRLPPRLAT
jgi:hypothetical protein